jgi:Family of unknown function (DUF6325)
LTDAGTPDLDPVVTDLVAYFVIAVPDLDSLDRAVPALANLVEAGAIRILDLVTLEKDGDGGLAVREIEAVASLAGMAAVDGEVGAMLSDDDIELVSSVVDPGTAAVVLVIEDRWAGPLSQAVQGVGGEIVGGEHIPRARVEAVLARRRLTLGQGE